MRHNDKTVDDAMLAFDWLDRQGISLVAPENFQPVKFGSRKFGQFEAFENKLTTIGVDQVLAANNVEVSISAGQMTVELSSAPAPQPLASFFSATKGEETENAVVFHVKIKRGKRTPQQLLDYTGRRLYPNAYVVTTMPLIEGRDWEEFDFEVFKVGKQISDVQVEKERAKRNSTRDLEVQTLINAAFPEFADQHPNGDSWQDENKSWCFALFYRDDDERCVRVNRNAAGWSDGIWFGGRKVSK